MPRIPKPRINLKLARKCRKCVVTDPNVSSEKSGLDNTLLTAAAVRLFRSADTDKSGTLSKAEYEAAIGFDKLAKTSAGITQEDFLSLLSRRRGGNVRPVPNATVAVEPITTQQYIRMSLKIGLPFVAFGFVDNLIMITAGDQIEASVGVALSLSTMAAAGLGNMLSDVVGIGASDRIEDLIVKLGLPAAGLTVAQLSSKGAYRARICAQVLGISIGCLLGMCPLLLIDEDRRKLKSSFEDADKDNDGMLTTLELSMALHRSGLMVDEEEIEWLVQRCGKTTHTSLNFDEFVELAKHWNDFNHQYEASRGNKIKGVDKKDILANKIIFSK